ncbi:uncharacterized protein LOC122519202 [Polistes fuscatus]|uniref:uncharacterized protein LOC122519202 n=1 Tax=Polistes fuscatus TaxID=30207 RepID=UPI001CA9C2DF|nr:uncharacterized protein LOC122519202 [Polistes fuscatus]
MADEEVENDIDQELKSLVESEEKFMEEDSVVCCRIEDTTISIDDDVKKGENDKEEVENNDGEKSGSIEKIKRFPQDSSDVSLKEESTTSSKLTENDKDELVQKGCRQCGRQFREIIGKQELKREELEKREGNLRQRLDVLECSMPAVMVWNVWQRMAQGAPIPNLQQLIEKQFRTPAAGESCCPNTPSQHYDCRIREVEAERKTAHRRLEEARILWLEKDAKLKERRDKLEEAKKIQEERKGKIECLTKEAKKLRETLKKMDEQSEDEMAGFCESGECGDVQCRERWLRGVSSVDSIKAIDVECLARLRQLAESELMMKKQIAELERKEETYMRTLQHADEMWSKIEGDTADTSSALQEQLDRKANANQQLASRICELEDELEKLRVRMALCRSELTKYTSVEKIETIIGGEDDFAKTTDKMVGIRPKVAAKVIGREDDLADVLDKEILIKDKQDDKETLAKVDVQDKEVSPVIGRPTEPMEPEKMDAMHKYLAMLGSLEELYYDDDYGICGSEFACYEENWQGIATDVELSTTYTGSTPVISEKIIPTDDIKEELDEEIEEDDILTQLIDEAIVKSEFKHIPEDSKEIDETFKKEDDYEEEEIYEEIYEPEDILEEIDKPVIDQDNAIIPLNKLRSWVNNVDSIRLVISVRITL